MPRYFFILAFPDEKEIKDFKGKRFQSDAAAIEFACRLIGDLRKDRRPGEPKPTIIVKNEAGEVVYRFPTN